MGGGGVQVCVCVGEKKWEGRCRGGLYPLMWPTPISFKCFVEIDHIQGSRSDFCKQSCPTRPMAKESFPFPVPHGFYAKMPPPRIVHDGPYFSFLMTFSIRRWKNNKIRIFKQHLRICTRFSSSTPEQPWHLLSCHSFQSPERHIP